MSDFGERQYLGQLESVLENGTYKKDRTGVGCYSVFGGMMTFDLREQKLPLLTTKKMGIKSIVAELLWFLEGSTNSKRLNTLGAKIWNEWALEDGELGPIYGKQWLSWDDTRTINFEEWLANEEWYTTQGFRLTGDYVDTESGTEMAVISREVNQIQRLVDSLKQNPNSRRHIVSAWNPSVLPNDSLTPQENVELGRAALPACHTLFQVHTRELSVEERKAKVEHHSHQEYLNGNGDKTLDQITATLDELGVVRHALTLQFYCRSQDLPIGTPYNIASYGVLAHMLAQVTGMEAESLIWMGGDCHIYQGQIEGVEEQLTRTPHNPPILKLNPVVKDLGDFTQSDFMLEGYDPHPRIDFGNIAV